MIQFLSKIAISAVFLVLFIYGYGSFCDYFFTQDRFLDLSEKKQWVLAQKGNSVDYAVLGSSRAYGAFDMVLLDSLTGKKGINLGSNGSGFKDNYLVLNLFLKSNSIKELFLQVDMASLNSKASFSNEFHSFTFLPYWDDREVQKVLKKEISSYNNQLTSLFPQWRYFYFNKYFSPKEVIRRYKYNLGQIDHLSKTKGGSESHQKEKGSQKINLYSLPHVADSVDLEYLNMIKELSEKNGIQVVFFVAPRYKDNQNELKIVLEDFELTKIYPVGFEISDSTLFQDQGHLSEQGKIFFTHQISKSLN